MLNPKKYCWREKKNCTSDFDYSLPNIPYFIMSESLFHLKDKVALITGASRGIGAAIALQLGLSGAKIVLSGRKEEALKETSQKLISSGIDCHYFPGNNGVEKDNQALVDFTLKTFGGVDILVNNSASNPVFGPVENTETWAFEKIISVNLKGPFDLSKMVLPSFKVRGGGVIIHISSIGGLRPEPGLGIYSVSKAALISLAKVMAKEWGQYGVRVNTICPGLIQTKFSEALWTNDKIRNMMLGQLPLSRIGTPEEIAALALFLASPASSYTTGAVFTADGGYTI
jgi:NAD(P)-dependent dehydrogenase (short-subunit alcohol dehydrogenase family)